MHIGCRYFTRSIRTVQAGVNSAAVDTGYTCHIFRFFHTAFDFKGINACFYQLRDKFYRAHILQAQRIAFLSVLAGQDPVGLPAWLGAPAAVPASAAQKAAEKALARIAIAHGSMDKGFHLHAAFPAQRFYFPKGQLSCRNDTADAQLLQEFGAPHIRNGHLCAGMKLQSRKKGTQQRQRPDILHDYAIQPRFIKRADKILQLPHFILLKKRIYSKIEPFPIKMRLLQGIHYLCVTEVSGIGPGPEPLSSYIYGIRAGLQRRLKTGIVPGRRK